MPLPCVVFAVAVVGRNIVVVIVVVVVVVISGMGVGRTMVKGVVVCLAGFGGSVKRFGML